uniref:C-JID domain-containing protein n=1 Tax=Fagus sylvatica TaxID=28930 RepID=A0A2N9HV49_FAGSY
MHDLLQELGKEIVRRESPKEPGGRSRLWRTEDILHVLKNNTGTKQVQGIVLKTPLPKNEDLDAKAFSKMKNLRILEIRSGRFPQGLTYLPNELRLLEWHECPLKSMPTGFQPNNLVQLRMRKSRIKQLWRGVVSLNGLKLIDLCSSQNLIEIPDLSGAPNLEELNLLNCTRLSKIDPSFGNLKCLIKVNMSGCKNLESLPDYISLESLEYFDLSYCSRLKKFPNIVGNMSRLMYLVLRESGVKDLSVEHLTGLIQLNLDKLGGIAIKLLPPSIVRLKSLRWLYLKGCGGLSPEQLNLLLSNLSALRYISVDGCTSLETLAIRPEDDFHPSLSLLNCVKLIGNQGYGSDIFLTMLRHYFQKPDCRGIDVYTPGSEIPKWFRHQSVGASMVFLEEGPSDFMGIAVCAVFVHHQHHPLHESPSKILNLHLQWFHSLMAFTAEREGGCIDLESVESRWFDEESFAVNVGSNQYYGAGMEVTKCGARLVDKKAIEDLKQSMTGCSMIPYDGDELGTTLSLSCGEAATSNDVDAPHPKRIPLLNLNETACEEEESQ